MEIIELKELLFELYNDYNKDYNIIKNILRSMETEKEITANEYDIIINNYENWLKEYNKKA